MINLTFKANAWQAGRNENTTAIECRPYRTVTLLNADHTQSQNTYLSCETWDGSV